MQWSDVINDPCLQDLPYKIELNRWGNIEMSPASNLHAFHQARLSHLLSTLLRGGAPFTECSVFTVEGVKVPDVAWCSTEFLRQHGFETPFANAPDLCIEIVSPSNSRWQMLEKIRIYLAAGAKEAWLVSEDGRISAFDGAGEISTSGLGVDLMALGESLRESF